MTETLLIVGGRAITMSEALLATLGLIAGVLVIGLVVVLRHMGARAGAEALAAEQARETEERLAELARLQAEMKGRVQAMADGLGTRQAEMARAVSERLDGLTHRIGHSMTESTRSTGESLAKLHERMGVIDSAQRSLGELSNRVLELKTVLADKQTRGAFGQGRMEAIIQDQLPPGGYTFQATLPTGARPDCLIHFPNGQPPLVIDAKFPLEGWTLFREEDDPDLKMRAAQGFRRDIGQHVRDIRDKYLLPGETQDTAFLFVPSESIFADLHEHFDDMIQRAHRSRVVIVSPSLLMLSIQVVQAILRDHRMREQAHLIQAEVGALMDDVERIVERVAKMQSHFSQTTRDMEQVQVSADKLRRRGARIEGLDLSEPPSDDRVIPAPFGSRLAGE